MQKPSMEASQATAAQAPSSSSNSVNNTEISNADPVQKQPALSIDKTYQSNNHRSRAGATVKHLVLHYTAVPFNTTMGIFTNNAALAAKDKPLFEGSGCDPVQLSKNEVSAHFVVRESGHVHQLVEDKDRAAYHAGLSYWNNIRNINNHSIGIEHVNIGYAWLPKYRPSPCGQVIPGSKQAWYLYSYPQIQSSIALCQNLIQKYNIPPFNVVGHSDVAPGRKVDPGPLFPWQALAQQGIGLWPDPQQSTLKQLPADPVAHAKSQLKYYGYDPQRVDDDKTFGQVMQAFQMHFRPDNIDGKIDLDSLQRLDSLCQQKHRLLAAPEKEVSASVRKLKL